MSDISPIAGMPSINNIQVDETTSSSNVAKDGSSDKRASDQFTALSKSLGVKVVNGKLDLSSLLKSVDGLKKLEFLISQAMIFIAKNVMDQYLESMKDSIDESRLGIDYAKEQAHDIKQQGMFAMGGAIAGGIMSIASAGVTMAGSAASMKAGTSAGGKFKLGAFQASQARWTGASQATTSSGSMVDGGMKFCSAESQADASQDQAESSKAATDASTIKDSASADQKFIDQLLQVLMAIMDADHNVKSKISG